MIADDDIFNQLILENYLKESEFRDFKIVKAFNGMQAQEFYIQYNSLVNPSSKISIIIMDCQMPIMDGYTVTRHIRKLVESGEYLDCAIIAHTGNSGAQEEKKCKAAGFDSYLYKPSAKNDFINAVRNHLISLN